MAEGRLNGRNALVTGGASGLGQAIAEAFAAEGATVTVADINGDAAKDIAEKIGGKHWQVDLADTEALDELSLNYDILVNNAGIQHIEALENFPLDKWQLINKLMLEAPFVLTKAVLPGMYERGFGRIINMSSVHGLRASAYKSAMLRPSTGSWGSPRPPRWKADRRVLPPMPSTPATS